MRYTVLKQDKKYIQHLPSIRLKKIGRVLNQGVHHRVYAYGRNQVLKIPRKRFTFLYSEKSHLEEDLLLLKKYAPHLLLNTNILASTDHKYHCVIQDRAHSFQTLDTRTVRNVWPQLHELLLLNQQLLKKERVAIDFLGGAGVFSCMASLLGKKTLPHFSNTVIIDQKIRLIDTDLLRLKMSNYSWQECLRFWMSVFSLITSEICLRVFFLKKKV